MPGRRYELGFLYGHGKGVEQDHAEAVKWYRKAAEQGHVEAQYELRFAYDLGDEVFGDGVPQDDAEAAK